MSKSFHYEIIGDGLECENLINLVARLDLKEYVTFWARENGRIKDCLRRNAGYSIYMQPSSVEEDSVHSQRKKL